MGKVARSFKLFAAEQVTARNVRIALVLLTLITLVIAAGAPSGFGD